MATGAPDRGGGNRNGFGAGRHGRTGGRGHVWQPVRHRGGCGARGGRGGSDGGRGRGRGNGDGGAQDDSSSDCDRTADKGWDGVAPSTVERPRSGHQEEMKPERKHDTPPPQQGQVPKGEGKEPRQPADQVEATNKQNPNSSHGCKLCGLKNHMSENCNCSRMHCEMCGLNNHRSVECKREPLWNCAPELCAAKVAGQSFFYIEESIDSRASKEKASTAVISVVSGSATAKQIETEFKNLTSNEIWIWKAKQISENKFSMRFPNAKMVQEWGHFRPLGLRTVEAQIVIDPWSPPSGAKGELQHAWFKVSGIPPDQRSLRTIAKVGGLVGKTLEIDEKTRYRNDYVRVRIACRDVTQVPAVAESSLGLFIFDFSFEREMIAPAEQSVRSAGVSNIEKCETWRLRGNEAYAKGQLIEAEELYTHGIDSFSLNESSSKATPLMLCYSNRAATRMCLGKMREALSDCRKATDIDPSFLKAQVRAAKCLLALGDVEEAQKAFDMCLKTNHLSTLDHKIMEDVSAGLRKAQKISSFIRQSNEYLIRKEFDKIPCALEMISDALSISIYSDNLMEMKAEALLLRYEEVIQFCEETLCVAERNSACFCVDEHSESNDLDNNSCCVKLWRDHLIAKSYFFLGKLKEAHQFSKNYEQMEVMQCSNHGNQFHHSPQLLRLKAAGNEAFQSGKYLEAVEHYTTALLSNSESLHFLAVCFCNRAAAYQAMGQILDAIADCSLAIALDSDYAKAFSRRSSLYELISDYDQATNDLRRLIALLEKQLQENMSTPLEKTESIRGNLNQANLRLSSLERDSRKGASSNIGIEPSSSAVDIKKAYHKAALRHHPDKAGKFLVRSENISNTVWREITNEIRRDADYLFKIIGQAYATLSDPTTVSSTEMSYICFRLLLLHVVFFYNNSHVK
ncbi:hypothetical protein U9M48_020195 [Paspalum notatum var. saurae]|uniref:J domain-containing protein n=1 Tax=Paspalum notatum var. saurae TaxID=547442 RepID=A0AAQ3TE09_PASNO